MCNELEGVLSPAENHAARSGPGASKAGEQDPTAPGVPGPWGGGIGNARAPLCRWGAEGQHDPERHLTPPLSQTSESPGRARFGISEKKGLIQHWLPSTGGHLSLQPEH